jgi:hypothetical protein
MNRPWTRVPLVTRDRPRSGDPVKLQNGNTVYVAEAPVRKVVNRDAYRVTVTGGRKIKVVEYRTSFLWTEASL